MSHFHVFMESENGNEYINTIFENQYDAAYQFYQIARGFAFETPNFSDLNVESIAAVLDDDEEGMLVWTETLYLKAARCEGGCFSRSWN